MSFKLTPWKKKNRELNVRDEYPLTRFRNDFESLLDRFWDDWRSGGLTPLSDRGFASRVDLDENEKEYTLKAELPGFEPEDFDVKLVGDTLSLRAEHKEECKEENGSYQRYGSYFESFTLPQGVLTDEIDARYHSGVLEVHLPKSEESEAKRIEVTSP